MPKFKKTPVAEAIPAEVSSVTTNSPDLVGLSNVQEILNALANRHFGKRAQSTFTAATFTTSSTTFVNIQSITTPNLASGTYVVFGYASYLKTLLAGQIETRFFLNGTTQFSLGQVSMDDDDYFYQNTDIAIMTLSGVNTITLQMRKANGGGDIEARNRTIVFWRIA